MFQKRAVLFVLLFATIALIPKQAAGATYYISPSGSDSSSGSTSSPWRTFGSALPRLRAGDSLLLKDGTYTLFTTGMITINCAIHANGTPSNPITVRAENERRAFLSSNGLMRPISVVNCSSWDISGIYVRSDDAVIGGIGGLIGIYYSNHITIRRMLLVHPNGCINDHVVTVFAGSNNLIEENELYDFHRHGIALEGGEMLSTVRRNYSNSRGSADLWCSPFPSWPNYRGDSSYITYPGSYNVIENNISEGNGVGYVVEAIGNSDSNGFYGNISMNDVVGFSAVAREPGGSDYYMPRNSVVQDLLVVNAASVGVSVRSTKTPDSRTFRCSVRLVSVSSLMRRSGRTPATAIPVRSSRMRSLPGHTTVSTYWSRIRSRANTAAEIRSTIKVRPVSEVRNLERRRLTWNRA
jgi:hypothetical protein